MQENRDRSTLRPRFFAFIFPIQKGGHAQMERYEYPFSALVGQEKLKTALLLNLVEPRLGGVLIQGEKGTAKSTAVRGLAELMDEVEVAENIRKNYWKSMESLRWREVMKPVISQRNS